jgi:TPR repeat protein
VAETVAERTGTSGATLRDLAAQAVQGELGARFELGRRLKLGIDRPADPHAALPHFCAAARAGHAEAAYTLGRMFLMGLGLPRDRAQAAAWFDRAARAGHGGARTGLSRLPRPPAGEPVCSGPELAQRDYRPPGRLTRMIRRLAPRYGLDPDLVLAVVAVESAFRADAVSPMQARGLMQLTDATAARFGVADPLDAEQNLRGGMRFLAHLVDLYGGDLSLVLAAYNAGPGAVSRHAGVPPYAETRAYIVKVRRYYPRDRHPPMVPAEMVPADLAPDDLAPPDAPGGPPQVAQAGEGPTTLPPAVTPASRTAAPIR